MACKTLQQITAATAALVRSAEREEGGKREGEGEERVTHDKCTGGE
jgi:hypothetical protein